jgi:hypothetical protein
VSLGSSCLDFSVAVAADRIVELDHAPLDLLACDDPDAADEVAGARGLGELDTVANLEATSGDEFGHAGDEVAADLDDGRDLFKVIVKYPEHERVEQCLDFIRRGDEGFGDVVECHHGQRVDHVLGRIGPAGDRALIGSSNHGLHCGRSAQVVRISSGSQTPPSKSSRNPTSTGWPYFFMVEM